MVRRRNSGLDFWFSTVDEVTFRASVSVRGDGFSRQDAKTETEATLCLDVRPSHSGGIVASLAADWAAVFSHRVLHKTDGSRSFSGTLTLNTSASHSGQRGHRQE